MGVVLKKNIFNFCNFEFLGVYLSKILPGVEKIVIHKDAIYLTVKKESLISVASLLKNHFYLQFKSLMDIWGVDYPQKAKRFEVNYLFLSLKYNVRVIIRVYVEEFEGLPTLTGLFKSAGWLEREVWDMYGVLFFENPDLRRILTDYGFSGHPLRKDFPLSGFMEVRYDDSEKRVVYEPLELSQQYRTFNFKSPWEKL